MIPSKYILLYRSYIRIRGPRNIMTVPLSPIFNSILQFRPGDSVAHQIHRHSQTLHIPIPRLVIKEQHILIPQPGRLLQLVEMCDLTPRVYLHVVKELNRLPLLPVCICDM